MRKIFSSVMLLVAAVTMSVACSKTVDPIAPENKLVGVWKAPITSTSGLMDDLRGKNLIINANHTATFSFLSFNNWKIEGDMLTFTNYHAEGVDRHVEVLRYTINNFTDTSMLLTGYYIYAVGDSIYQESDMSGLFKRDTTQAAQ